MTLSEQTKPKPSSTTPPPPPPTLPTSTTSTKSTTSTDYYNLQTTPQNGAWIGIDFGTTNSCCAIWDVSKTRAKLLRLEDIAIPPQLSKKGGRIVPSAVLFQTSQTTTVGHNALRRLEDDANSEEERARIAKALITSVKRIIGFKMDLDDDDEEDEEFRKSLPFETCRSDDNGELSIRITPLDDTESSSPLTLLPTDIVTLFLKSIKQSAEAHLSSSSSKLSPLGGSSGSNNTIPNCIIGVPAHFGRYQRHLLQTSCHDAGFTGHVSCITESTAAAMAYGFFATSTKKSILVFDMGGGTTDVTIGEMIDGKFFVKVTEGAKRLGGDDIDGLLADWVLGMMKGIEERKMTKQRYRQLVRECQRAKEELCGDGRNVPPRESVTISFHHETIPLTQERFESLIAPLLTKASSLLQTAITSYTKTTTTTTLKIDEVIFIGGGSRIPAIRTLLHRHIPHVLEFCTSIDPLTAVAQGTAIQSALVSELIPKHELKSALMLDALPHSIGVRLELRFSEILKKNQVLPAKGHATFRLSDKQQKGVTIVVVEDVGEGVLVEMGTFNVLLHKLSPKLLEHMEERCVEVGMMVDVDGKFVVSVFDENDPEHVERRRRRRKCEEEEGVEVERNNATMEQVLLGVGCVLVFGLYVVVKIVFGGMVVEEGGARIV